jgi:predicted DNA repair protein MutK
MKPMLLLACFFLSSFFLCFNTSNILLRVFKVEEMKTDIATRLSALERKMERKCWTQQTIDFVIMAELRRKTPNNRMCFICKVVWFASLIILL